MKSKVKTQELILEVENDETGANLDESGSHLNNKITCKVSDEARLMWEKIVEYEKKHSPKKKRYYPAHTMEKLIKAHYELIEAGFLNP